MITIRKSADRGVFNIPGLNSKHSFSFGDYYHPEHMGFHKLRVINDDSITGGFGFPTHPHKNMEIVTYVLQGAIEHQDSMGNKEVIPAGEMQRMTAGKGVRHSEYNASKDTPSHFLQIWIEPAQMELEPAYEQKKIEARDGELVLAASSRKAEGAMFINQDAQIFVGKIQAGSEVKLPVSSNRYGWVQMIEGSLEVTTAAGHTETIEAGDGLAIAGEEPMIAKVKNAAHFLLFDLP